jgi:hypothetical protein
MAAFLAVRRRQRPRQRVFRERIGLNTVLDNNDLADYRLSEGVLREVIRGFTASPFANKCKRSRALTPETQVITQSYIQKP